MLAASPVLRAGRCALALLALVVLAPATARAERVLVLHPETAAGQASAGGADLARVEGAVIAALVSMGHEPLRDESATPPADAAAAQALGAGRGATYVVRVRALPTQAGYVAQITAHDVRTGTAREGSGEIVQLREVSQLAEVLTPLLVPEPAAGTDADTDTDADAESGTETDADADPETEPEPETEAEPGAASVAGAQEAWGARERERQEAAAREAWEGRERYGVPLPMLLQGGLALRPLANRPAVLSSAVMGAVELRFGYGLPKAPGLELRGSVEGSFGAMSGFGLMGGAVYLFSPFIDAPVHFGPSLELGWLQSFAEGFDHAFFASRVAAVVSWHFGDGWYLEGAVPEIMVLAGASLVPVTVGLAVRVGRRF